MSTEQVSVYDFKAHLSEVISRIERTGAGVVVTRHGRPVVRVLPTEPPGTPRPVGMWRGKMTLPAGWDEFTDQDAVDWYGA